MPRESRGILKCNFTTCHLTRCSKPFLILRHFYHFFQMHGIKPNPDWESIGCKKNHIVQKTLKSSLTRELQCFGASNVLITCCTLFNCQTCIYLWRCDFKLTSQVWTETNSTVSCTLIGITTVISLHAICRESDKKGKLNTLFSVECLDLGGVHI